jgi:c-di-GMP phosphodiesterase
MLSMLQDPESDLAKLDREISKDVSLSYKLLRYVNSSYFQVPTKIDSIHRALILLGVDNIRNWVSLIALSGINDKPNYLILDAMVRARMCELLAESAKRPHRERYFTVGLFSLLDALLDLPMERILRSLPLSEELGAALLRHEGDLGEALRCVLDYEHSDWEVLAYDALDTHAIKETYLHAISWARESITALAGGKAG